MTSRAVGLDRRKHNSFNLIDKIFEDLNSILNISQEPHDFLIFTGAMTIYISLRSIHPKFPFKKTPTDVFLIRLASILKLSVTGFAILVKHFWGPFLRFFTAGKVYLV